MLYLKYGVDVLPSFRFLSVHTVSIFGHIARYAPSSADTLPSKEIRKSVKANLYNPPIETFPGYPQGVSHKIKTVEQVSNASDITPSWFKKGIEATLLAPTAVKTNRSFHLNT